MTNEELMKLGNAFAEGLYEGLVNNSTEVNRENDDLIRRQDAVDALWKALYDYEDKTEKQFLESEELDVSDWFSHRIFVQHMSDIDRQTILNMPSAEPIIRCRDCKHYSREFGWNCVEYMVCSLDGLHIPLRSKNDYCSRAERRTDEGHDIQTGCD